jgi:hypothetical protein
MCCVSALLQGRRLTLTGIGRAMQGQAYPKHSIKRFVKIPQGQTTIMSWLNSTCPSVVVAIHVIRFEGLIGLVDGEREIGVLPSPNGKPYAA